MDKKNIVKSPFGVPKEKTTENKDESVTRPPTFVRNQTTTRPEETQTTTSRPPTFVRNQTSSHQEDNQTNNNKITHNAKLPPNKINESISSTDKENDDIAMKEYESMKKLNSSKNFLRLTTDRLPANSSLLKEASFPIGMIINPFCFQEELQNINYGEKDIPRCFSSQCRAYINPFVKWIDGGEKWICNLCKNINTTEEFYYAKLDKYGNRVDMHEKPDLSLGSYEFIANRTYMRKDKLPNSPVFVFVIDVSQMSSQNGFLSAVLESIKDTINSDSIPYPDRTKVAFITYDNSVHFYSLNQKLTQPQMLCISDENVFLPTVLDSLLVQLDKSKKLALTALDLIQSSFSNNSCKDSNKLFTAIQAAFLLTKNTGGKIIVFNASHAMTNLPKMKSNATINIPRDELIYTPTDDKQLSTLGINLTNENISCDIFVASESYVNLITLNQICDYTNGNLYFYKNFRLEAHYKNIFNQIRRVLTRFTCMEAVIRTRFSRGYKISNFMTPVLISNQDLMICSELDSDQTYTVQLDINDSDQATPGVIEKSINSNDFFVYIQTAILFTHPDGTRRIRIHNLCVPVATKLIDIYEGIDVDSFSTYFMKMTVDKILKTKKISNSVLSSEVSYKSFVAAVLSVQQSLKKELPENLVFLPLYILGVLKHRICCKDELDRKLDVDLSNYLRIKIQKMNYLDVMAFVYPRIYPLHQILYDESLGNFNENGNVNMPQITSTYYNMLESDGIYLIDNGFLLILYTKSNANTKLLKSIFGVEDLSLINPPLFEDNILNDPDELKQKIINMVDYVRGTKSLFQNLIFVFEGTDGERIIKEALIEDNFCPWMTVDFKTFYTNSVEINSSSGFRPGMR